VWTMPYLLEFALGMWIALGANLLSFRLPAWSFWPGICASLVASGIYFSSQGGHYAVSATTVLLASLFVLIGAFAMAPKSTRILNGAMAAVGDSSYSLYLTHMFSIRAIVLIIGYLGLQSFVPPAATWLAVVGVCAASAYVNYLLLECR
ncbi:acyltransferase family protein, partial [Ensifer sp. P24N7]|uniref:acyltransferase family protein n=1 Tax=Sinorhizobium sp. P24N7 TaxID=3348358 RepID=UPI0035F3F4CD